MKIEILVSTMNQEDYKIIDTMHINSDVVVVNQCNKEERIEFQYKDHHVLWINTLERGLSNSRNMAMKNSTADICVLADDDEVFREDYIRTLKKVFQENGDYDIIRFKINGIEKTFKKYSDKSFRIGFLKSLKVSSVEIAFRRKEILKKHIKFDPLIGSGTKFPMGEENSFLFHCLRKKLKIKYIPEIIADLHMGNSTWFTGYNKTYFVGRGAAFTSMSKWLAPLFIFQFAVRKRKLYKNELSFYESIKYMFQGRKEYIKNTSKNPILNTQNEDIFE